MGAGGGVETGPQHLFRAGAGPYGARMQAPRILAERLELIVSRETGQWAAAETLSATAENKRGSGHPG